jgi:hypothetical protein
LFYCIIPRYEEDEQAREKASERNYREGQARTS